MLIVDTGSREVSFYIVGEISDFMTVSENDFKSLVSVGVQVFYRKFLAECRR